MLDLLERPEFSFKRLFSHYIISKEYQKCHLHLFDKAAVFRLLQVDPQIEGAADTKVSDDWSEYF